MKASFIILAVMLINSTLEHIPKQSNERQFKTIRQQIFNRNLSSLKKIKEIQPYRFLKLDEEEYYHNFQKISEEASIYIKDYQKCLEGIDESEWN